MNSTIVFLFKRTQTSTPPLIPAGSLNYSFSSGFVSGSLNGWEQSLPVVGGAYRWVTSAVVTDETDSTTISVSAWKAVAMLSEDGTTRHTATIYKQSALDPGSPVATASSYDFVLGVLVPPVGWSVTQPATTTVNTWAAEYTFVGLDNEIVIGTGYWGQTKVVAVAGIDGQHAHVVTIYKQTIEDVEIPTGGSYKFDGDILVVPAGWSRTMPTVSDRPTYMSTHRFSSNNPLEVILGTSWSYPVVISRLGFDYVNRFISTCFTYSLDTPAIPVDGDYDNPVPTGWSDGIPTIVEGQDLWSTSRIFYASNLIAKPWSTPVKVTNNSSLSNKLQFSSDNSSWHDSPVMGDVYMRSGTNDGNGWVFSGSVVIKGEAGVEGAAGAAGSTLYTWIAYAFDLGGVNGFTTGSPADEHKCIGIAHNKSSSIESTNPSDYRWTQWVGGVGATGANGYTTFTWFAYANSADGVTDFTTGARVDHLYIGMAFNKFTMEESQDPADYAWSRMSALDPASMLETLTGAISESQLHQDLAARIDLIDDPVSGLIPDVANLTLDLNNFSDVVSNLITVEDERWQRLLFEKEVTDATVEVSATGFCTLSQYTDEVSCIAGGGVWKPPGTIRLKAIADITTDVEARLTTVQVDLDAVEGTLTNLVGTVTAHSDDIDSYLTSENSVISQLQGQVSLSASSAYVDLKTDEIASAADVAALAVEREIPEALAYLVLHNDDARQKLRSGAANIAIAQQDIITNATAIEAEAISRLQLAAIVEVNQAFVTENYYTKSTIDSASAGWIQSAVTTSNSNTTSSLQSYTNSADMTEAISTAKSVIAASLNATFRQTSVPVTRVGGLPLVIGDLWVKDVAGGDERYLYDGEGWALSSDAVSAANTAAIAVEQNVRAKVAGPLWANVGFAKDETAVDTEGNLYQCILTHQTGQILTNTLYWKPIQANLYAQYNVKLDVNGKVIGYGLSNDGATSKMLIEVDEFAVLKPGAVDGDLVPFAVLTTPMTINGIDMTPGVYVNQANISHLNAGGVVTKGLTTDTLIAETGTIFEDIINVGKITNAYIDDTIQSTNWNSSTRTGWLIDKNGNIQGKSLVVEDASITTAKIGDAQVDTLQIKGQAVTVPQTGYVSRVPHTTGYYCDTIVISSFSVDSDLAGQPIIVSYQMYVETSGTAPSYVQVSARCSYTGDPVNITLDQTATMVGGISYSSGMGIITNGLPVGAYSFSIYCAFIASNGTPFSCYANSVTCSMSIIGAKR